MPSPYSAISYYISSVPTLIKGTNWTAYPVLMIKKPLLIRVSGNLKFYVNNFMDIWTLKEVILDRQYERLKAVKNNDVVIDIGAGIGDFSILSSKKASKVYAYEMDKNRVDLMRKNLRLNNCGNVELNGQARSLDDIFIQKRIKYCDFLKIDCEGCEYTIFGNTDKKYLNKIGFIAMEAHLLDEKMKKQYRELITLFKSYFLIEEIPNAVHSYIRFVFAYKKRFDYDKSRNYRSCFNS